MNGSFLRFYVHEGHRHHHHLVWEWLLQQANKLGIRGGSAFKAMAGFGRHHVLHEAHFIELAGSLAVEIEFIVTDDEAQRLLSRSGVTVEIENGRADKEETLRRGGDHAHRAAGSTGAAGSLLNSTTSLWILTASGGLTGRCGRE